MKLEQINSEQDVVAYIEICLNNFQYSLQNKTQTKGRIAELIIHLINIDRKNREAKGTIETVFEKMKADGDLDKIDEELKILKAHKLPILKECIQKAHHKLIFEKYDEFVEYCNQLGIYPTEDEIKKYRK